VLAWYTFGGVALVGLAMSFRIKGEKLEADGWGENGGEVEEGDEEGVQESREELEQGLPRDRKGRCLSGW
jgi:hypothetical protein